MTDQPQETTESPKRQHRLHPLKKIEIIVRGEKEKFVQDLLEECGATGYTVHRDIAGRGAHGFHEGRLLFNDRAGLVMFFAVGDDEMIDCVMDGLTPLFEKSSGVMFVSNTQVVRLEKFLEEDEK
ncbi:transcriptional regulator [Longibacter salinarum]|uniref:Transcriptional regulator n=1 Tax=Longibacter salinarum TaxID=1850348 RepID=A0A2A8CXF5_9BACT|nr:P-II family nitrogen regulator [Longibacter salinarum]PEN13068.1 transcriptional regulator [Longibacter salinarum]